MCKLDDYKRYLHERIGQARPRWIPATVLLREIRERGYAGGISQLKAWLAPLKKNEPEPLERFETPPGQQMQADFTYVRRGRDPLLALVATLGYSRASYVKFVACAGEDVATLCAGLREAFDYFGGVPEHVLFDNTKAVVIERDAYGEGQHRWNAELRELAVPAVRLAEERAVMLAAPALEAPAPIRQRVVLPVESLQHPLAVYDALLEVV